MIRVHTTVRVVHRKWNICIRDRYAEVVDFGPKHFAQHPDRQVGAELAEFTGSDIEKTLLNALRSRRPGGWSRRQFFGQLGLRLCGINRLGCSKVGQCIDLLACLHQEPRFPNDAA